MNERRAQGFARSRANLQTQLETMIQAAKRARDLSRTGWFATGFGSGISSGREGTAARAVRGELDTLGSNLAFQALQEMRQNSPTGGALGAVTERELQLLQSTLQSLDQGADDATFQRRMEEIIAQLERSRAEITGGQYVPGLDNMSNEERSRRGLPLRDEPPKPIPGGNDEELIIDVEGGRIPEGYEEIFTPAGVRWINRQTGDVFDPATNQREALPARLAAAASRGATNVLGAPVDLINSGLGALGLPVSDTPFLGSRSIANMISAIPNALLGADSDIYGARVRPQSGLEQFGQNALEVAGGGVIPVAALYGRGASVLGGGGPGGGNALAQGIDRMAIETARRPGVAVASEAGASVGAAGGMSGADAIDPNNALLRATLGTAGGFAGGFATGMAAGRAGPGDLAPAMQAADRQQIPMMPADVAGPGIRRATSAIAQTAPGAGPIVRAGQATQNAAGAARTRVANQVGAPDTPQAAGEAAIRGGRSFQARTSHEANRLYRRAETQAGDTQVDMVNARRVLDEHIAELSQTPGGATGLELLRDLRRELDGAFPVDGVRRMRTQLRDRFEPGSDAARRAGQVVDAAAEDVVAALNGAGRPEAARSYQAADRYWRMRATTIDNVLEPILGRNAQTGRIGTRSGEDVVARLQQAARGRNRQLEAFVRALPEEERGTVRATLINELGRPGAGSPIQGNFSLETFLSNWRNITRNRESLGMVRRLFGNSAVDALEDIATVATSARQANTYANRSNTGGAVGNMATGATAFAGWETLLATVATQHLTGRLLASPRFARWLARSSRADPNAHIQRLSGIASAEPAIASEVMSLREGLLRAANENTVSRAAASPDERQQDN